MHEPLLERIRELERSIRRWRLVSLALLLTLLGFMAISGTFGVVLFMREADLWGVRARAMEDQERARVQTERALQEVEAAKKQAEQGRPQGADGENP
jgi:hypothetical protein